MLVREATFVVTDTETTGTTPGGDRLIEIGAVRVERGRIVDRFSALINPQRSVPRFITELTGISTGMVFQEPTAAEVLPRFLDFLGDAVLVAHNLPFDRRFLDAELARMGRPPLRNASLCTLRLARRLLPGLRSKGLAQVADFYGLKFRARHRALGDAEVTAEVLLRFLSQAGFEYGIESVEELLSFQHRKYSAPRREPKHLKRIREEVLVRLPERPGVYFMLDAAGAIIYVGKAKNLRSRVRSYFNAIEAHSAHVRNLVERVRDLTWTETGSELGALLLESRLIKEHQPAFNRVLRRYRNRPFIRLEVQEDFPRVTFSSYLHNDGAEYFGPLAGRGQAEMVIDIINRFFLLRECDADTFARASQCVYHAMGRCAAPCQGGAGADGYAAEVDRVRAFLKGRDTTVLGHLEREMRAAAARLDFEEAASFRNWFQNLDRLLTRQRNVAAPVLDHHAVLVLPGAQAGTVQLFFIRFGRLAEVLTLSESRQAHEADLVAEVCARVFDPSQAVPDQYLKREVDEVHILAHWLYTYRDSARQVAWRPEIPLPEFVGQVLELLAGGAAVEPGADEAYDPEEEEATALDAR